MTAASALRSSTLGGSADEPALGTRSLEPALVARVRSGDPLAFRLVFDRYARAVRRFLRDLLREPAAADEATQETFVRAHRLIGRLRDDERLGGWLFGIARNVAMEQLRQRRRAVASADSAREPRDPAPSPEARLIGEESVEVLDRALAALGHDRRAALLLRIDHELGYEEIGSALGWSLAKVKNEVHRARLELRSLLSDYLEGAP
jgi:RNA polymerase sigma-70 factor (ECF subfamily)